MSFFLLVTTAQTETTKKAVIEKTEEIKQAKSELELILNSTADGIYGIGQAERIIFANSAAQKMVGYSLDEISNIKLHGLIHHTKINGDPCPSSDCKIHASATTGKSAYVNNEISGGKMVVIFQQNTLAHQSKNTMVILPVPLSYLKTSPSIN